MDNQPITREAFRSATLGHELDTEDIQLDPRLARAGLENADRNGDGVIRGEEEIDELFNRMTQTRGRRRGCASRTMLEALSQRMQAGELSNLCEDLERAKREAVLLVGLNDASVAEAQALRRLTDVVYIGDLSSGDNCIEGANGRISLNSSEGIQEFVQQLPLSSEQRQSLEKLLIDTPTGARREVADLASVWVEAEVGGTIPGRLMLSGHGDQDSLFGTSDERIPDRIIITLAQLLPRAASQVRSLHIAACQHGYEPRMQPCYRGLSQPGEYLGIFGFRPKRTRGAPTPGVVGARNTTARQQCCGSPAFSCARHPTR